MNVYVIAVTLTLCACNKASASKVRLVDGPSPNSGRLEVFYNGEWGTVCRDGFNTYGNENTMVVCRMLGLTGGTALLQNVVHGSGKIWLDNVACVGSEEDIEDCPHLAWGEHDCTHPWDIGVLCDVLVRLVGGSNPYGGRLEILNDGEWGTVCAEGFLSHGDENADVVCRMLGVDLGGSVVQPVNKYGAGSGSIWLDDVNCTGSEQAIMSCSHGDWGQTYCNHSQDVGIDCSTIRLVGGAGPHAGRLEVFHQGKWGTVCSDGFPYSTENAEVVCRSLGFAEGQSVKYVYGPGSGKIWLDNVECTGSEQDIRDCVHNELGQHDCSHTADIGIKCEAVRLVNGTNPYNGRLEIFHDGQWGTVCHNTTTSHVSKTADVVCGMLGMTDGGTEARPANTFGRGAGRVWLDELRCTGSELIFTECSHGIWGQADCNHIQDVGIVCALPCPTLLVPVNGQLEGETNEVLFFCHPGYELNGVNTLTCVKQGDTWIWNNDPPTCTIRNCESPELPTDGEIFGGFFTYKSMVKWTCDSTFRLVGSAEATCLANGTWSSDTPRCEKIMCEALPHIDNGKRQDPDFNIDSRVSFSCNEGHELQGEEILTCVLHVNENEALWNHASPNCTKKSCEAPMIPEHGSINSEDFRFGSWINFRCDEGYELMGMSSIQCDVAGWNGNDHTCTATSEGPESVLQTGETTQDPTSYITGIVVVVILALVATIVYVIWRRLSKRPSKTTTTATFELASISLRKNMDRPLPCRPDTVYDYIPEDYFDKDRNNPDSEPAPCADACSVRVDNEYVKEPGQDEDMHLGGERLAQAPVHCDVEDYMMPEPE